MSSPYYDEGYYKCRIVQQAMGKAGTGTPQFVLRFTVLEFSDGSPVAQQYERTCYRYITDKTMQYFERDLETLGFTGTSLRQLDPSISGYQSFIGNTFEFRSTHEADQKSEVREKWSLALPNGPGREVEVVPVDSATYRQLDAMFGRNKGATRTSAPPAEPPSAAPPPTGNQPARQSAAFSRAVERTQITDDDIPF